MNLRDEPSHIVSGELNKNVAIRNQTVMKIAVAIYFTNSSNIIFGSLTIGIDGKPSNI